MPAPDIPFLPKKLTKRLIAPGLKGGLSGLADLMQNPGGLAPNVSEAINPRLAMESQSIAQNFTGIRQEQAGAAARSNLPTSIKGALDAALNVSQEGAQRGARQEAMSQSEALRRDDLKTTMDLLALLLGNKPKDTPDDDSGQSAIIGALGSILAAYAGKPA